MLSNKACEATVAAYNHVGMYTVRPRPGQRGSCQRHGSNPPTVFLLSLGGRTKEGNRKVWFEAQRDLSVGTVAGFGNPPMVSSRVNVSERPFKWATSIDAARAGRAADVIHRFNAALHEMNRGQHQLALLLPR